MVAMARVLGVFHRGHLHCRRAGVAHRSIRTSGRNPLDAADGLVPAAGVVTADSVRISQRLSMGRSRNEFSIDSGRMGGRGFLCRRAVACSTGETRGAASVIRP